MGIAERTGALTDRVTMAALSRARDARGASEPIGPDRLGFIRASQFAAVMSLAPMMMIANAVNSAALIMLEHRNGTLTIATLAWAALVWLFAMNGIMAARRFAKAPRRRTAGRRAPGRVLLSSMLLAALWCYPVIALLPSGSQLEIAFISALTAGMIAGGAIALYPVPLAALGFVVVLSLSCIPAIFCSILPQKAPFIIVIAAFLGVVAQSILRHTGLFLAELLGRLEAERRQDVVDMLIRAHASSGGHALWRADDALRIVGNPGGLAAVLKLPAGDTAQRLPRLLAATGCAPHADEDSETLGRIMAEDGPYPDAFDFTVTSSSGDVLRLVGQRAARDGVAPFGFHGWIKDVTAETRAQQRVHWLATRDKTTGLLNHAAFLEEAQLTCAQHADTGSFAMTMFIDADKLKDVNDSYGHVVGDLLILEIAQKLKDGVPPGGLLARKGGDEFLVLVVAESEVACRALAETLTGELNACSGANGSDLPLSCSAGAVIKPVAEAKPDEMELEADRALYRAKADGGCRLSIYDQRAGEELRRARMLAQGIPAAIADGQLSLVFQPIWRIADRHPRPIGAEALIRWRHPHFGSIPAADIVSLAANAGCSDALTEFVLRRAAAAAQEWPENAVLSVNLSAGMLHRHRFAETVLDLIEEAGLPTWRLWLEITESEQHRESPAMQRNMALLRDAGVVMAVDDFGAGYSTLAMLDVGPLDAIKIDRSLVQGCPERKGSAIVLATLVQVAAANDCLIVAEGVETNEELSAIRAAGIALAQGNYLSPALDARAVEAVFAEQPQLLAAV